MAYRLTPRGEERRTRRQEQILRAARRLFGRHGYQATTMQQIASAARTSIGNLYFYFGKKEILLRRLLETAMQIEWARADAIAEQLPPGPARLAVMAYCNAEWLMGRDRAITLILFEASVERHLADWLAAVNATRVSRYLLMNTPALVADDPAIAVALWVGAGRASLEEFLRRGDTGVPWDQVTALLRWNFRGLGVPDAEIDRALDTAKGAIAAAHDPK